jgi:hypothetical protein
VERLRSIPAWTLGALLGVAGLVWSYVFQSTPRPGEFELSQLPSVGAMVLTALAGVVGGIAAWLTVKELRSSRRSVRVVIALALSLAGTAVAFLMVSIPVILWAAGAAALASPLQNLWTIPLVVLFSFGYAAMVTFLPALPYGLVAGLVFSIVAESRRWLHAI